MRIGSTFIGYERTTTKPEEEILDFFQIKPTNASPDWTGNCYSITFLPDTKCNIMINNSGFWIPTEAFGTNTEDMEIRSIKVKEIGIHFLFKGCV